ncbi:Carbonic anhydrase [Sphingobium indicum BiD32]|uniref:Carbonic anhydrase n=1 Tax=Sphingobium indicum BiD32 TaxID=1301087 RepID=N1MIE3_9SPHN|nr:carbonic anhydrase [Sphingobium indicum]CCW17000.1 Carbonic anhydrase [Sphingobium indicum BiD32]
MRSTRENWNEEPVIAEGRDDCHSLFSRNRAWAQAKTGDDPSFFKRLVGQQHPRYFWIGCSDSRVPATEIVDLDPGEMFVHRNVANLAVDSDPNFSAALQFAVDVLKVEHIIVVGHYGCGGIQAAMAPATDDAIGVWLAPVRALHEAHGCSAQADADRLCERNILSQVEALAANPLIRRAWDQRAPLTLHGWVYAIGDGLLQQVCEPVRGPWQTEP